MSASAEIAPRVRVSDPRPAFCSGCYRGAEGGVRFVDFDAAFDSGTIVNPETMAVLASGDDLHLCEACVREATEALALRPQATANQLREIRRLERELDALRDYTRNLEATLANRPEMPTKGRR